MIWVVLAIDPGPTRSAIVKIRSTGQILGEKVENDALLEFLRFSTEGTGPLVIEQVEHYGMPAGRDIFETVFWSGRFWEAWERRGCGVYRLPRRQVKLHLCGTSRAKDGNVRQALIDRYGGKERAVGNVKAKGPLHGIAGDEWQALALGLTWLDLGKEADRPRVGD